MNEKRRSVLREAAGLLDNTLEIVRKVLMQESFALENIPENIRDSDRCEKMESGIESLDEALQSIIEAKAAIDQASS